ncbi:MAG: prepilin-type N-terminal cleavage/methylation domain-containing protein, partial [Patescibacteria group bacterium]|nr:prepilin-type N-terminal cleavage/methylation domain-containing protein [Patescibacteria group bacterium]
MTGTRKHSGFTLLEVILALAILAGAAAVLSQMAWSGLENARLTGDRITAQILAESLMAELDAGIHALES